jgi:hypothetical protein
VEECYQEALGTLRANRDKLDSLALRLLERETLDEDEAYEAAGVTQTPAPDRTEAAIAALNRTAAAHAAHAAQEDSTPGD